MMRTLALLLLAAAGPVFAAPDAYWDQMSGQTGDNPSVRAGEIVQQAQKVSQVDPMSGPSRPANLEADVPPALPPAPSHQGGFMSGLKSFLNWDNRSMPAFAIGMAIGFGIVVFSGMFIANPLLAIAGGLFAGLVIGFMLNAFK